MGVIRNFEVSNMNYDKSEGEYNVVKDGTVKKFNIPTNLPDECIFMYAGKELVLNYSMPDDNAQELQTNQYTEEQINNKIEELKASIRSNIGNTIQLNSVKAEVRNDDAIVINTKS